MKNKIIQIINSTYVFKLYKLLYKQNKMKNKSIINIKYNLLKQKTNFKNLFSKLNQRKILNKQKQIIMIKKLINIVKIKVKFNF